MGHCDAALTETKCPATSCLTAHYVEHFCECALSAYSDSSITQSIANVYEVNFVATGKKGVICDMSFNQWIGDHAYAWGRGLVIKDASSVFEWDGMSYASDSRISKLNHGASMFHKRKYFHLDYNVKAFQFEDAGVICKTYPAAKQVKMLSGHYQGGSKILMATHFTSFLSSGHTF